MTQGQEKRRPAPFCSLRLIIVAWYSISNLALGPLFHWSNIHLLSIQQVNIAIFQPYDGHNTLIYSQMGIEEQHQT